MRFQPSYNQLFTCPYSFQAQEHDDELKGDGNSVNYKYRMHDPRLGRFFAVDPLAKSYPYYTPYQFSGNRVIDMIELEGLEPYTINLTEPGVAIFNSASITHGSSNPGIVFICPDAKGTQVTVTRKMTTFELSANKPIITQNNQIKQGLQFGQIEIDGVPAKFDTRHSVKSGEFVARSTFINGSERKVPFLSEVPNTVTNTVEGSSGYSGKESIKLNIANGATQGSVSFDHYGPLINSFSVTDQDGNTIPMITLEAGGITELTIVRFDIKPGTTSINLNVSGIPDKTNPINNERIPMDQWRAEVLTSGPVPESSVGDSFYYNESNAVSQTTSGVQISRAKGSTYSNPVNP